MISAGLDDRQTSQGGRTVTALMGLAALVLIRGAAGLAAPTGSGSAKVSMGRGIVLRQAGLVCLAGGGGDTGGAMPCFAIPGAAPSAWYGLPGGH